MSRQKPSREQQKRISAKIRKLINEGYEPDQAAAIAYEYSREHKLGPRGGVERNPISLNEKFILFVLPRMNLHISSWGDYSTTVSVENIIKHVIPSIHENIEHGNDIEFIGKKFFRKSSKPYNGIEPFVIEYKDKSGIAIYHKDEETLDYLIANMIIPEIHRYFPGEFESNPRHELEREFSTALYLLSKKPNLINQIPSNIKELFQKAGYVHGNQITEAGEKYLKFIKSRVAREAIASNPHGHYLQGKVIKKHGEFFARVLDKGILKDRLFHLKNQKDGPGLYGETIYFLINENDEATDYHTHDEYLNELHSSPDRYEVVFEDDPHDLDYEPYSDDDLERY